MVWIGGLFSNLGAIYTFIPKFVADIFGAQNCTEICSVILLAEIPAAIVFGAIASNLVDSVTAHNSVLTIGTALGVFATILTLTVSPQNVVDHRMQRKEETLQNDDFFPYPFGRKIQSEHSTNDTMITASTPRKALCGTGYHLTESLMPKHPPKWNERVSSLSISRLLNGYGSCGRRYFAVFGGMLVMMTIGTTFCFGNIKSYIASYLAFKSCHDDLDRQDMETLFSTYSVATNYIFCAMVVFEAIGSVIGGKLENGLGADNCALLGSSILSLGCALTHYTVDNIIGMTLTFGVMFGIGAGIASVPLSLFLSLCLSLFFSLWP